MSSKRFYASRSNEHEVDSKNLFASSCCVIANFIKKKKTLINLIKYLITVLRLAKLYCLTLLRR